MTNEYLKFWGVRGTFPLASRSFQTYGGNTSCVALHLNNRTIILDAGTGLYHLGNAMLKETKMKPFDLFLSHTHIDHILGFPFFAPFYKKKYKGTIYAGHLPPPHTIRETLDKFMSPPFFPIPIDRFSAAINFVNLSPYQSLQLDDDLTVQSLPLHHPDGATGYRINYKKKSICYITDIEHLENQLNTELCEFIEGSDYFIYDSTYNDEEYQKHKNWGHSTWQEGFRLAQKARVKNFMLFHHDPSHDDVFLEELNQKVKTLSPHTIIAKEGVEIIL